MLEQSVNFKELYNFKEFLLLLRVANVKAAPENRANSEYLKLPLGPDLGNLFISHNSYLFNGFSSVSF